MQQKENTKINEHMLNDDSEFIEIKQFNKLTNTLYSMRYRILKTILLFFGWISMSINTELIAPSLEDVRILLSINYQQISLMLIIRTIGYLIVTALFGLILDKLLNYSDIIIAISKIFMIIRKHAINICHFLNIF